MAPCSQSRSLGSYISSTEKDIRIRKAHAWRTLHDLKNIWHSAMPGDLKTAIFMASVESILLYGSEAWTLNCSARSSARWLLHKYAQDECSMLHGGIGSGMGSSMEISLGSLQRPGREDFEWQATVSDTLNWLQPSSFYGNRRRDELHEAASL